MGLMSRPTEFPRWCHDGVVANVANIVSPSAGERSAGHQAGTAAAAQKMNWIQELQFEWLVYLDGGGHEDRTLALGLSGAVHSAGAVAIGSNNTLAWTSAGAGDTLVIPVPVSPGDRLRSVVVHGLWPTAVNRTIGMSKRLTGVASSIFSASVAFPGVAADVAHDFSDYTVVAGDIVGFHYTSAAATEVIYGVSIVRDRP
jgi:hypothetical protein